MKKPSLRKRRILRAALVTVAVLAATLLVLFLVNEKTGFIDEKLYPREYEDYVCRYAAQYDVPESLLFAVIRTESGFRPDARSPVGALGLMQLMPATFRWLSDDMLGEHLEDGMILDPETNIRYGAYYLRRLYDRYGNWLTATAAYNAGIGNVDEWLEQGLADGSGTLIPDKIPFRETRNYVATIRDTREVYERLYP